MNTTRRSSKLLAVATASALVIAACGSDDEPAAEEPADSEAPVETEATEDEPVETEAPADTTAEEPADTTAEAPADGPTELAGLTVVDDKTFTVELTEADPEFNLRLAYSGFSPLPEAFFDDPAAFEEMPIGNGPFMMDGAWDHDVAIKTVPYPDYAGPDVPNISSLTFNLYEDSVTTGYLDLQAGVNDVVRNIPADQLETAPTEFGDRFKQSPDTGIYYYGFPSYLEEQYPLNLRRALSMATDRVLLNDVILAGTNVPAYSLIPPNLAGAREEVCENWTFNVEAAQAAFAEFGGLDALGDEPLVVWFNTSESHAQIAEAITNMWREHLGIDNVVFENLEFSEYLPKLDAGEITGVFRLGWGADYLSPLNFLEPLYSVANQPPVGSNSTFTNNADFEAAIAEGKAAIAASGELADAIPFYNAAEDALCEEVPSIPIYFTVNKYVWNDTIDNVVQDAQSTLNYSYMTGGDVSTAAGEPEHLTPPNSNESEGIEVLSALFRQLVENDPVTSEPQLVVAESIETTDGGKTYTITVADGWTFHDGTPVTAQSFVDAWNYTANGANAQSNNGFFSNIVGYAELNAVEE